MTKTIQPETAIIKAEQRLAVMNQYGMPDMAAIDEFATAVLASPLASNFKQKGKAKDDIDEDAIRANIISNIVLAKDMGIGVGGALVLGSKLNVNSYFSVLKGKSMGMEAISAIQNIHIIPTKNGDIISIGVNAINMALMRVNIQVTVLKDYSPTPIYRDAYTHAYVGYHEQLFPLDKEPSAFVFDAKEHSKDDVKEARAKGQIIVVSTKEFTYITQVHFYRKSNDMTIVIPYTIQDAIDAELCAGYHSTLQSADGKGAFYVKGKLNWNQNRQTMLRNRSISIGGRIIAGDILQGGYSHDEVVDMVNIQDSKDYTTIDEVREAKIAH